MGYDEGEFHCSPFYFMKIVSPSFERKYYPAGTYKIVFDEQFFYIGSSRNLRYRFNRWKSILSTGKYLKNINIQQILRSTEKIEINILKVYANPNLILKEENRLIKKFWNNQFLLNRCPDSTSPKGMRKYNGYMPPLKPIKNRIDFSKKVAQFDKNGIFLKQFSSIAAATRYLNISKSDTIRRHLKGEQGLVLRQFEFRLVGVAGEFIEHKKFTPKKRPLGIIHSYVRKVHQFDINWNLITEHRSSGIAAKAMGCSKEHIINACTGRNKTKRAKGFYFRYAS